MPFLDVVLPLVLFGLGKTSAIKKILMHQVEPQTLPQASAAAKFPSLRVYYQIIGWKGCSLHYPNEWGWHLIEGKCLPMLLN